MNEYKVIKSNQFSKIMGGKLASNQLSSERVKPHVIRISFEKYISISIGKSVRSCFLDTLIQTYT